MRKLFILLLPILVIGIIGCKKKKDEDPVEHPGSFTYQGYSYNLDKCFLEHYAKKGDVYIMGIWMTGSAIYEDQSSQYGFTGKDNYVGYEVFSSDSTLVPGNYYYSDTGDLMTWEDAEFGHPFDWTQGIGNWAWLVDGVINVSKQNGIYTFTFSSTSENGYILNGSYTGSVIHSYWPGKKK